MNIMLLKVNYVALHFQPLQFVRLTVGQPFRAQRRIVWLTAFTFECDQWRKKAYMEITEWKETTESAVHGARKWLKNCGTSLLMPK